MKKQGRELRQFIQRNHILYIPRNCMRVKLWMESEGGKVLSEVDVKSGVDWVEHIKHEPGLLKRIIRVELVK